MTGTRESGADGSRDHARLGVLLAIVDFPMLSSSFRDVIDRERDMHVVGESTTREAIVADVRATGADIVLTECEPFGGPGCPTFEAIEQICLTHNYGFSGLFINTGGGFVDASNIEQIAPLVEQQIR